MQVDDSPFPSIAQAVLLLLAHFLLQYLVGAALYDLRGRLGLTASQVQPLVMLLASGVLIACVTHHRRMTYRNLLHPARSSVPATLMLLVPPVLLLTPLLLLLDHAFMVVAHQVFALSQWEQQAFMRMLAGDLPTLVAVCVLAPVLEELLFRGILLRAFLQRHSRWAAVSSSALLFGIAHLNVYQFVLAFWLGLLLGWLFERSRSLIPCIALHAAFNTAVVLLEHVREPQGPSPLELAGMPAWLAALAAAALGAVVLRRILAPARRAAQTQTEAS